MTQIPDPTRSDEDRGQQVPYFRISAEPIRQPLFTNLTNVSFMQGSFYLDFAYVDPSQLGDPQNEVADDGRPIIDAMPLVHLTFTPESAVSLYMRLGEFLGYINRIPSDNQSDNRPQEP